MVEASQVAFFDIGGTLGQPRISLPPHRLAVLDVYPYVTKILDELQVGGIRLGIISNTGNETSESMEKVLKAAELYEYFDPELLIYSSVEGMKKDSPAIFQLAAERAGHSTSPTKCLFVGEDSRERQYALEAGLTVAPHPLLVARVLDGERLRYVRLTVPVSEVTEQWRVVLRDLRVVPLHSAGEGGSTLHAIVPQSSLPRLVNALFDVQILGDVDEPLTTDLYLLHDDLATSTDFLSDVGQAERLFGDAALDQFLLSSSQEGLVVRVAGDRSIEEVHPEDAQHGHTLKLRADPSLLAPFGTAASGMAIDWLVAEGIDPPLSESELEVFEQLTANVLQAYLDRYTGVEPLGDETGTVLNSRHVLSADNARAADMLALDLQRIGGTDFTVHMHPFTHDGRTLYNVVAELTGELADEVVLVTAHLDSTAASSPPYDPVNDPAPGADDDASGIAAVLAGAATLQRLATAQKPKRTLRFVLFNAEEHGLVGSSAYARDVAAQSASIVAVYQMDMIGYNVAAPRSFEVHAGFSPAADVQTRSLALAQRIQRSAAAVSPLLESPQLYASTGPGPGQRDPAEGRSDHYPFQQRGYAACVTSEDFFIGPAPDSPAQEPNPNYHRRTDTFVDLAYAADIARCVAAAAWTTANIAAPDSEDGATSPRFCSGATQPGTTNWQAYGSNSGIYADIDTSSCGFTSTPRYFASIGGTGGQWSTTGTTSIYRVSPTQFRVYVRWANGSALTPADANARRWHINWCAIEY